MLMRYDNYNSAQKTITAWKENIVYFIFVQRYKMSQQPKQKFSDRQIEEYKAAFSLFDKVTFNLFPLINISVV